MSGFFNNKKKPKKHELIESLSSLSRPTHFTNTDFLKPSFTTDSVTEKVDNLTISQDTLESTSDTIGVSTLKNSKSSKLSKNPNSNFKDKFEWAIKLKILPLGILTGFFFSGATLSFVYHDGLRNKSVQQDAYFSKVEQSFEIIGKDTLIMRTSSKPTSAINSLEKEKSNVNQIIQVLEKGGRIAKNVTIPPLQGNARKELIQFKKDWSQTDLMIDEIVKQRSSILAAKDYVNNLKMASTQMLNDASMIQKYLLTKDNNSAELASGLVLSVYKSLNEITRADTVALTSEKKQLLSTELRNISLYLNALKNKYGADSIELSNSLRDYEKSVEKYLDKDTALKNINILSNLNDLNIKLFSQSYKLKKNVENVHHTLSLTNFSNDHLTNISVSFSILGAVMLLLISLSLYARSIKTLRLANEFKKNQSNEKALNELLKQIQPLDDGDFTSQIYIEDKFLMNLSRRIDKTRIQFGEIVKQMKGSSHNIIKAAETTDNTSQSLLEISNKQFTKLASSINTINDITNSIDEIAQTTWIAQGESTKSAEESQKGEELVSQSIAKMNEIRNTIQESSKKIKKLGESAQSITEVTSLIKNITKQINILALNAAIHAASSGESGREFTVVAQEVQRLADDSEDATKRIEELINEIQSDTAAAISSMEKTTQEVVSGAQLTEQAGIVLKDINQLSKTTAEQIKEASSQLEEKSSAMANVTVEMQSLEKIFREAQQAVQKNNEQVEALKNISKELEDTFKQYRV